MKFKRLQLKGLVEKANEKDGILTVAVATDGSIDRDGEVIQPDAWNFDNFLKNPVLLYAHDYRSEPIGKVISIQKDGDRILFQPQFAIDLSERAARIFRMYKEGFLNAFSVGFNPTERKGNIFTKVELLEISAVPVPANPNALVLARSAGIEVDDIEGEAAKFEKAPGAGDCQNCHGNGSFPAKIFGTEKDVECEDCKGSGKAELAAAPENSDMPALIAKAIEEKMPEIKSAILAELKTPLEELKGELVEIKKQLAANSGNEPKVEDLLGNLLENPQLVRGVLAQIDKGVGLALRDLKKGADAR